MDRRKVKEILTKVKKGELAISRAVDMLAMPPYLDAEVAKIDCHRALRHGFPEVVLGEGKTAEQIIAILKVHLEHSPTVLVTRVSEEKAKEVEKIFPQGNYNPMARTLVFSKGKIPIRGKGTILVVSAGTSDMPVAEESAVTAEVMGNKVERLYDVGVAGIHRLLANSDKLRKARVIIVVAGMEGALASVVGGMVDKPVIAVPTSIGYGASFGGISALLSMLNSCASNVTVQNIDNGFGAGYVASIINRL